MARVEKPSTLRVIREEKAQVKVLVEQVVQLVRDRVTGMDLLEVFLSRRIQPLQAHDHPMWMYSGLEDSTRIHLEDVSEDTVEQWLRGITGNKDNPRGSRRVVPFNHSRQLEQVLFCFAKYLLDSLCDTLLMVDCISFARCPFRLSLICTGCPMECRSKTSRKV